MTENSALTRPSWVSQSFVLNYFLPALMFAALPLSILSGIPGIIQLGGLGPFLGMCLYILIDFTHQGFVRRDRFRLSQKHPYLNKILTVLIVGLPFVALILFHPAVLILIVPVLLILHIISERRSPDRHQPQGLGNPVRKYGVWLGCYMASVAAAILIILTTQ